MEGGAALQVETAPVRRTSAWAIASLVLGIVGLVGLWIVGPILALVFGSVARREIDESHGQLGGREFAKAGTILAVVSLAISFVVALLLVATFALPTRMEIGETRQVEVPSREPSIVLEYAPVPPAEP